MSALAATKLSENSRGVVFKVTGDGAATQITVTTNQYLSREQSGTNFVYGNDSANAQVFDTPTAFFYPGSSDSTNKDTTGYKATGMLCPTGGTQLTVNSVSIAAGANSGSGPNPTTVITITVSAALTSAHTIYGWIAWQQDRPQI